MATPTPINANAIVPYVGMYSIPMRLMPEAKARGCNTLYKAELENGNAKRGDWRAVARDLGFYYVDEPSDDLAADLADPFLLGWCLPHSDEWNRVRGTTLQDPAPLVEQARNFRTAATAAGKWVTANADGQAITTSLFEKPPYNGVKGNEVRVMRELTLRTMDDYPVNNTSANTPEQIARRPMYLPAQALYRMQRWMAMDAAAVVADYGVIVEAQKGWNSPLAVTPDQMREQRDYLLGRKPFPWPVDDVFDGSKKTTDSIKVMPRLWVWWTGNGQNGPGWKWIAQTDEQRQAQIEITTELLGTPAAPPPEPGPLPDAPVTRAEWEAWKVQVNEAINAVGDAALKAAHAAELASADVTSARDTAAEAVREWRALQRFFASRPGGDGGGGD